MTLDKKIEVLAIMHVAHEDAGSFGDILQSHGITIKNIFAQNADFSSLDPLKPDLLLVMGGPMGVYEDDIHSFLKPEIEFVQRRLVADLPTLGICLGSQIMAKALGANVYKGKSGQEIGWGSLDITQNASNNPLRYLEGTNVLHWHGDTFDLPNGANLLASTDKYKNQAFSFGKNALALQFHPEVTQERLEAWYEEDPKGVMDSGKTVDELRADAETFGGDLIAKNKKFFEQWLKGVAPQII